MLVALAAFPHFGSNNLYTTETAKLAWNNATQVNGAPHLGSTLRSTSTAQLTIKLARFDHFLE
jgi:hypothetical protein